MTRRLPCKPQQRRLSPLDQRAPGIGSIQPDPLARLTLSDQEKIPQLWLGAGGHTPFPDDHRGDQPQNATTTAGHRRRAQRAKHHLCRARQGSQPAGFCSGCTWGTARRCGVSVPAPFDPDACGHRGRDAGRCRICSATCGRRPNRRIALHSPDHRGQNHPDPSGAGRPGARRQRSEPDYNRHNHVRSGTGLRTTARGLVSCQDQKTWR